MSVDRSRDLSAAAVRETLPQLRLTPQHFKRTASGLTDAQLRRPPEKDSWSVNEVLAHLRGAADVQGGWIARMLEDDTPTIRYASPRTGMRKADYAEQEFQASLRDFARQRAELVKRLSSLALPDWSRGATFTGTTPGWTQTVLQVARGIVAHEQAHFDQIAAAAREPTRQPRRPVRVLGIDVPAHLSARWRMWLAPDPQPFFLAPSEIAPPGATDGEMTLEFRDTFRTYAIDRDLKVVWLSERSFRAVPNIRARLVREQVNVRRGAVPIVRRWTDLLDPRSSGRKRTATASLVAVDGG